MYSLLLFITFITVAALTYLLGNAIGNRIGYLKGMEEVSNISRGGPP